MYACLYYTPHTAKNYLELSDLQSPINKTLISQKTEIQVVFYFVYNIFININLTYFILVFIDLYRNFVATFD